MGYVELLAKFDPWPFIMAFYLGLVGFFSEMKLCYVGEWGLMWCRNQAFEPINWQALATYGNGMWDYFPDLTILGHVLDFLDWSTFSERRKGCSVGD